MKIAATVKITGGLAAADDAAHTDVLGTAAYATREAPGVRAFGAVGSKLWASTVRALRPAGLNGVGRGVDPDRLPSVGVDAQAESVSVGTP